MGVESLGCLDPRSVVEELMKRISCTALAVPSCKIVVSGSRFTTSPVRLDVLSALSGSLDSDFGSVGKTRIVCMRVFGPD